MFLEHLLEGNCPRQIRKGRNWWNRDRVKTVIIYSVMKWTRLLTRIKLEMENRVDPREFLKEEAIRLWGNGGWEEEKSQRRPNCYNHGSWFSGSQAYSNPVDPFLEEARATLTPERKINKAPVHFRSSQEHAHWPVSLFSVLSFYLEGTKKNAQSML